MLRFMKRNWSLFNYFYLRCGNTWVFRVNIISDLRWSFVILVLLYIFFIFFNTYMLLLWINVLYHLGGGGSG